MWLKTLDADIKKKSVIWKVTSRLLMALYFVFIAFSWLKKEGRKNNNKNCYCFGQEKVSGNIHSAFLHTTK